MIHCHYFLELGPYQGVTTYDDPHEQACFSWLFRLNLVCLNNNITVSARGLRLLLRSLELFDRQDLILLYDYTLATLRN